MLRSLRGGLLWGFLARWATGKRSLPRQKLAFQTGWQANPPGGWATGVRKVPAATTQVQLPVLSPGTQVKSCAGRGGDAAGVQPGFAGPRGHPVSLSDTQLERLTVAGLLSSRLSTGSPDLQGATLDPAPVLAARLRSLMETEGLGELGA